MIPSGGSLSAGSDLGCSLLAVVSGEVLRCRPVSPWAVASPWVVESLSPLESRLAEVLRWVAGWRLLRA